MNNCKRCGNCCDPIRLSFKIDARKRYDYAPKGWLQKHWRLKSKQNGVYFYSCDFFDIKTRLCKIHKNKPKVCREFPYEKEHPTDYKKYCPEGCGYLIDSRKRIFSS